MALHVEPFGGPPHEWDSFGSAQAGWTAFHRLAWRDVISDLYGHECPYLCARDGEGKIVGILPLVRVKSALFGHFLVSMPFVSYGGPVGSPEAVRLLAAEADAIAARTGVDLLELRSAIPLDTTWEVSHRKLTVVLPLVPGDGDATFKSLKSKVRSQTRRPMREGLEVRMGRDQVAAFHTVFSHHMRDLGTPTLPLAWFERLADAMGDDMWIACGWLNGRPISVGAGFRWHNEFEITWAASLREFNSISPNMGVYWTLIERAATEGLSRFNFGRCSPDSPTHKFKSQWGAVDEPLYWYRGPSGRAASTPRPDSKGFSLATRVWKHLPLPVATWLGPRLVRFIP